jgi:cyclopropane fatty-acyl-phospholipid synthase-like methyltransferase
MKKQKNELFHLKVQNAYVKPLLKPNNTYYKPYFETTYLDQNVKNFFNQK